MSSSPENPASLPDEPQSAQPRKTGDVFLVIPDAKEEVVTTTESGYKESKKDKRRRAKEKRHAAQKAEKRKDIERELQKISSIPMNQFPLGYPRQAAFQASRPSFSMYRAFEYLHARVLLELQDELRCLEEQLADLDALHFYSSDPRQKLRVSSRETDMVMARVEANKAAKVPKPSGTGALPKLAATYTPLPSTSERAALIANIRIKLLEYDEMLVKVRELAEFQRPTDRDWATFRAWFWNYKPLSNEAEEDFIRRKGDLITLRPRAEWGKFDGWIEANLPTLLNHVFREKAPHEITPDEDDPFTSYYSVTKIEKFTTLIIAFVIIILLAVPVFVMFRVSWQGGRGMTFLNVGLLIVFSSFFSAAMSLMTRARRAELFAASAAYSAVLIVFIANFAGTGDEAVGS